MSKLFLKTLLLIMFLFLMNGVLVYGDDSIWAPMTLRSKPFCSVSLVHTQAFNSARWNRNEQS